MARLRMDAVSSSPELAVRQGRPAAFRSAGSEPGPLRRWSLHVASGAGVHLTV